MPERLLTRMGNLNISPFAFQQFGNEITNDRANDFLFTRHGRPWRESSNICTVIRELGRKLAIEHLTPHRFRHTFAVTLLNYCMRETALQKLMGHAKLDVTLHYARILDHTVEAAFATAVSQMYAGPLSWAPDFFKTEDYTLFIRCCHGAARRLSQN